MGDIFDRNVHPLYSVMAFASALIVFLIIISEMQNRSGNKKNHMLLFIWVTFFCVQDGIWGLLASHSIHNDPALFFSSNIFHLSAVFSAFIWTIYFLSRVKDRIKYGKVYIISAFICVLIQVVMIIMNTKSRFMFYVDMRGWYQTTDYRAIMFYIQFATYIVIGVITLLATLRSKGVTRTELTAIFLVNLAPLLFGVFQMIYPDAPADSIGFAFGCVIIELFLTRKYEQQVVTLEEMQVQLNEALEQAESANKAKTSFLFSMSHDIRTPMNAILGFARIAENHIDDKERVQDAVMKIKSAGSQLLNLINEVLEMSRIESGKIDIVEAPASVQEMVMAIEPMMQSVAVAKSIDYQTIYGDISDQYVWADEMHVQQILTNIISNAIKYTPSGGKVRVYLTELASEEEGVANFKFTVTDTGIGMSPEFLEHLYDEFSRENTTTVSKQEGTGLGLSIAKRIADLMNAEMEVESALGAGTTFTITIPLRIMTSAEVSREFADSQKEANATENNAALLAGKKVLLVEDNELNREIANDILDDLGMVITEAEDGSIAVQILEELCKRGIREEYFDFILMDIQMPVMDGYTAAQAIRDLDDPLNTHIPIIAMTANAFAEDIEKSFAHGMDAHISKPIEANKLINAMANLL